MSGLYECWNRVKPHNREQIATLLCEGECKGDKYKGELELNNRNLDTPMTRAVHKEFPLSKTFGLYIPPYATTAAVVIPRKSYALWAFRSGTNSSHHNFAVFVSDTRTFHFRMAISHVMFLLRMLTSKPEDLPLLIGMPSSKKDQAILERLLKDPLLLNN